MELPGGRWEWGVADGEERSGPALPGLVSLHQPNQALKGRVGDKRTAGRLQESQHP